MRRTLLLFASLLLLWGLVAELNHALGAWRVYIFAGALFVAYAALTQPLEIGLTASLLGGLVCDANAPVAFGTHFILFAAAHLLIHHIRERVPRDDRIACILIVLFANLALFLLFSFTQIHRSPAPAAVWPRLFADLACSQVFLALVTPWFFALQERLVGLTAGLGAPRPAPRA
jgi:rod shape-determining protein MreD